MKLTVKQVGEKLGVGLSVVKRLIHEGKLVDVKERKEGAKKHFSLVESQQLNEFIKEHGKGNGVRIRKVHALAPVVHSAMPSAPSAGPTIMTRIEERLASLEAKVDALLGMWR